MLENVKEKIDKKKNLFSKKYVMPALLGVITLGTIGTAAVTHADGPQDSLIQKIASKFNVSESDVQAVFDENRAEMQKNREAETETKLQALVTEGKITASQKDALVAKMKEMHANRDEKKDEMKNLSEADRKAEHEARKTEMDKWFSDQGIDQTVLEGVFGPGKGGPHGPRA